MDVNIIGAGANADQEAQVDPTFRAFRTSLRPIEFAAPGAIGGHYALSATFTTTTAGPIANSILFAMRWADTRFLFVLERVTVSVGITTVFSAATALDFEIFAARSYTVNPTGGTNITLTTSDQKKRSPLMGGSMLATTGNLQISSGMGLSGGTFKLDSYPFGQGFSMASTTTVGAAGQPILLYDTTAGSHPMIFGPAEGFMIRNGIAYPATGNAKIGFTMYWAEVPNYDRS